MSSGPVESTIKEVYLRQEGLTEKDLQNYLDKEFGPGTYYAKMLHNTYYITAKYNVSLVRINFCTIVALELFCLWIGNNPAFLLYRQADVKKYAEEVEAAEAAEDTNTVTNEDNNAGGS